MHELEQKMEKVKHAKETLMDLLSTNLSCGMSDRNDLMENGQITDMIKDLSEVEKNCMKALYYEEVVTAMREPNRDYEQGDTLAGYDHWRRADGRFAPKGSGTYRRGFMPLDMNNPLKQYPHTNAPYGYVGIDLAHSSGRGDSYDMYQNAKRNYTSSGNEKDKEGMTTAINVHTNELVEDVEEMFRDASPENRRNMMRSIENLLETMKRAD